MIDVDRLEELLAKATPALWMDVPKPGYTKFNDDRALVIFLVNNAPAIIQALRVVGDEITDEMVYAYFDAWEKAFPPPKFEKWGRPIDPQLFERARKGIAAAWQRRASLRAPAAVEPSGMAMSMERIGGTRQDYRAAAVEECAKACKTVAEAYDRQADGAHMAMAYETEEMYRSLATGARNGIEAIRALAHQPGGEG